MKKHIYFGETVKGFDVPVLNEREARASAGILFVFAIVAFLNAFLLKNYLLLKIFIITFFLDFFIRVLVNPKFAPTLIAGRIAVHNQRPEYVGAPQKKFAWSIGLGLSALMFVLVVLLNLTGPINLAICIACLTLLFFETSFGICIGCKLYNLIPNKKAKHCPGGTCEIQFKDEIQEISMSQIMILVLFLILIGVIATILFLRNIFVAV